MNADSTTPSSNVQPFPVPIRTTPMEPTQTPLSIAAARRAQREDRIRVLTGIFAHMHFNSSLVELERISYTSALACERVARIAYGALERNGVREVIARHKALDEVWLRGACLTAEACDAVIDVYLDHLESEPSNLSTGQEGQGR